MDLKIKTFGDTTAFGESANDAPTGDVLVKAKSASSLFAPAKAAGGGSIFSGGASTFQNFFFTKKRQFSRGFKLIAVENGGAGAGLFSAPGKSASVTFGETANKTSFGGAGGKSALFGGAKKI